MPWSLPIGMCFTLSGLVLLAMAGSFEAVLIAAALVGTGSSVFHPESSRVARMASGGRHGLAQSLFQVGGNFGSSRPTAGRGDHRPIRQRQRGVVCAGRAAGDCGTGANQPLVCRAASREQGQTCSKGY